VDVLNPYQNSGRTKVVRTGIILGVKSVTVRVKKNGEKEHLVLPQKYVPNAERKNLVRVLV
jgi:uncharacterized linocin/CFP29 family protein